MEAFSSPIPGFQGHLDINIQPSDGGRVKRSDAGGFMDQAWKSHTFHWLELSFAATSNCKGDWKI